MVLAHRLASLLDSVVRAAPVASRRGLRPSRTAPRLPRLAASAVAIAAVALSALPAAADAPFEPSPWVAQVEDIAELTAGSDGALWSVESIDPIVLRRTTPGGTTSSVPLPGTGPVYDLAPGVGGDAVWVAVYNRVHRVTSAGSVTTVAMPAEVLDPHLEPSVAADRMWFVSDVAETGQNERTWGAGVVDAVGEVTFRSFPVATSGGPGELVAGPDDTRWFRGTSEGTTTLTRLEDDLTTTDIPVSGEVTGFVLGPDDLLWVAVDGPSGPAVDRLRADGSVTSSIPLPVAGGAAVLGPDGAVYFAIERGYLRVTPAGEVRPVLRAASEGNPRSHQPLESVTFAGDIFHVSSWTGAGPARLDLDGRPFPLVTAEVAGSVQTDGTATVAVQVAGGSGTATGTVTIVKTFCCYHGMASVLRAESATLGPDGRAQIAVAIEQSGTSFHVDYSGDGRYLGTTSLDQELPEDDRSNTERYIAQTYRDLLEREPEPVGLQYWTGALDGGAPRTAVAHALAISTEHRERFVEQLFDEYLDRPSEATGRDSFVADLGRGATMNQIRASILGSEEYFVRSGGGTVDGYIAALYRDVLGRQPDEPGRAFWRSELSRGVSMPTMASALLSSTEALRLLVDARFQELLRRSAEPAGRDYWAGLLQRGFREERLIAELVGADEYYARALTGTYT